MNNVFKMDFGAGRDDLDRQIASWLHTLQTELDMDGVSRLSAEEMELIRRDARAAFDRVSGAASKDAMLALAFLELLQFAVLRFRPTLARAFDAVRETEGDEPQGD